MTEPRPDSLGAIELEWREGDRTVARALAERYVDDRREALDARFGHLSLKQCVRLVDMYREDGDIENRLLVDAWLLSEYSPQNIGGDATVKLPRRGQKAVGTSG